MWIKKFVVAFRDDKMYWTDGLSNKIGRARIAESAVVRDDPYFLTSIAGIKGLVAVNTNHIIGLCCCK